MNPLLLFPAGLRRKIFNPAFDKNVVSILVLLHILLNFCSISLLLQHFCTLRILPFI